VTGERAVVATGLHPPPEEANGEEVARVFTGERPWNVVNPEVYAPGHPRRGR